MNKMLHAMKNLSIDFLSTLDYVDLQNLSQTDKKLSDICVNDTILRNILYQTYYEELSKSVYIKYYNKNNIPLPKVYLPPNFPIAEAQQLLYNNILKLVNINFPETLKWPRWINREKFKEDMIRNVYQDLCYKIRDYLYNQAYISQAIKDLKHVNITPTNSISPCLL
jgi:hypothetical protein